jgi:gluconolactonase
MLRGMKTHILAAAVLAALTAAAQDIATVTGLTGAVTAPGAAVTKVAGDCTFTEGPSPDADGNVFFTDQPNDRILRWGVDGKLSTFKQPAGRSNGMFFDRHGNLLACADEKNELWSIAPGGAVTVITNAYQGKPLNGPNDVWCRPDGGIYFTDPFYKRPWWTHTEPPQGTQQVYFLSSDRARLTRVTEDLVQPNGIIGTPDGKRLFVADIKAKKTYAYDVAEDGSLSGKRLFCELGSDGMTIDADGNLYLTGKGVSVFSPDGKLLEVIPVPERWSANVCFGGKDRGTLFITATTGLYAVPMRARGTAQGK